MSLCHRNKKTNMSHPDSLVLPFPALLESHIQDRKKAVLLGLFGLGVFITIIQLVRIQTIRRLIDPTDSARLILWSTVEINLGVIVATIPTLAPLVKYLNENAAGGLGIGIGEVGSVIFGGGGNNHPNKKNNNKKKNKNRNSAGGKKGHSTASDRKGSFPLDSGKFDGDDDESSDGVSRDGSFEMKRNIHSKELILGPMIVSPGPGTTGVKKDREKDKSSKSPRGLTVADAPEGVITMKTEVVVTYN